MIEWTSTDTLAPEYARAVGHFIGILKSESFDTREYIAENILCEGVTLKVLRPFSSKNIPSGEFWRWNQAKSRKQVALPYGHITFFKLTPRKRNKSPVTTSVPYHKLWQFYVVPNDKSISPYHILWCEKGGKRIQHQRTSKDNCFLSFSRFETCEMSHTPGISIQDLEFLAPFMDAAVANQLWPNTGHFKINL